MKALFAKLFGSKSAPPPDPEDVLVEDYLRLVSDGKSFVREESALPHPKDEIVKGLQAALRRAMKERNWKEYDRLKLAYLLLADFQDSEVCALRGMSPDRAMISEVRMRMGDLDSMAAELEKTA